MLIGCEDSPESTTLTGDKEALRRVMRKIKEANPDVLVRELHVDRAYHSREFNFTSPSPLWNSRTNYIANNPTDHMRQVASLYEELMNNRINARDPVMPFYSSVTCKARKSRAAWNWAPNTGLVTLSRSSGSRVLSVKFCKSPAARCSSR